MSAIASIVDEWRRLWRASTLTTPFQHPAWLLPWYRAYEPSRVRCLAIRRDGELIGVVPLCCINGEPCTVLKVAGAGISGYLDLISSDDERREVAAALGQWLVRHGEFDVLEASDLAPTSPLFAMETPATFDDSVTSHDACWALPLPSSMDALKHILPPERLASLGRVSTAVIDVATEATIDAYLLALVRLDESCCRARGARSAFADAPVSAFHLSAARGLLHEGIARLYVLKDDNAITCALYTLRDQRHTYYYASGCADDHRAESPGTVLVARALADAIADGHTCFDFLHCNDPFKRDWGANAGTTFARRFSRQPARLARSRSASTENTWMADETTASLAAR